MHRVVICTALLAVLYPAVVSADDAPSATFNISGTSIEGFCVYNNKLFSIGAKFCTQKSISEECQRIGGRNPQNGCLKRIRIATAILLPLLSRQILDHLWRALLDGWTDSFPSAERSDAELKDSRTSPVSGEASVGGSEPPGFAGGHLV